MTGFPVCVHTESLVTKNQAKPSIGMQSVLPLPMCPECHGDSAESSGQVGDDSLNIGNPERLCQYAVDFSRIDIDICISRQQ